MQLVSTRNSLFSTGLHSCGIEVNPKHDFILLTDITAWLVLVWLNIFTVLDSKVIIYG